MTERERQMRRNVEYAKGLYSLGWLDGFSAILWALVGDKLSDEMVAEYEAHIANVRDPMGVKEYTKEDVRWKS